MKNLKSMTIALLFVFSAATLSAQTKQIDVNKSKLTWVGKKVTGKHEGTVNLKEGSLVFKGKNLTGGTFTVDMNSINVTDLKSGEGKEKLEGHLKSDDFFGTDKFPTSVLVFKTIALNKSGSYTITADLTIKNITNQITFDMTVKGNMAVANLKIDRTKYGIKFKSTNFFENLGDKAIYDDFEITANLSF